MNRSSLLAGIVALGCLLHPGASFAQREQKPLVDVTGAWQFNVNTEAGSGNPTVTFVQKTERLTGRYSSTTFGNVDIVGSVKGAAIEFSFKVANGSNTVDVQYSGKVVGPNALKGAVKMSGLGNGMFSATRTPDKAPPKP